MSITKMGFHLQAWLGAQVYLSMNLDNLGPNKQKQNKTKSKQTNVCIIASQNI